MAATAPKLNDYVFTEKLGSGTYATVYKAYKKTGPRQVVAVKCVLKSSLNRASTENLLTEIELLKTLRHGHIVELIDFRWDACYIYLIMEYCAGGDLSKFIHSHRTISEHAAKRFLQQIALALQYMRSMNVSHMDLKPQNILLTSLHHPVLKLGDFGFAHYVIGDTDVPYLRGSPLYMAPEIVTKRHYNEKADLWSVGVILYECLFGRPPFASKSIQELGLKIKDSKPVEIPHGFHISSHCRHLLHGLLVRDPENRMSFPEFFSHPFTDLEHVPSSEALDKAVALVKAAVEEDKKQDYQRAINLYCQSLEFFVSAIHYEENVHKKEVLRQKVKDYMKRAEELKTLMKPKRSTSSEQRSATAQSERVKYRKLVSLSCDSEALEAALQVIESAQMKESSEDYSGALKQYQLALESLIKILQEEPPGEKKDLLQTLVPRWMSQAESIKQYVEVKDLSTEDRSQREEQEAKESASHITTGSWKGRGNQYIQFIRVLYCKLPTNGKQLPAFPLEAMPGTEPWPQRWEARVFFSRSAGMKTPRKRRVQHS